MSACGKSEHLDPTLVSALLLTLQNFPNKHDILYQCWFNAGPTPETAGQHYTLKHLMFAGIIHTQQTRHVDPMVG